MPAAAAIGVLLSEEGFGHMYFPPKSNGGFAIFSEAFGGERSTKTFTSYKLLRACMTRFYSSNVTLLSMYTPQPAALSSRIAAGNDVS